MDGIEFVDCQGGTVAVIARMGETEMHLFPFGSRDDALRYLEEATAMPRNLYELLRENGVRS